MADKEVGTTANTAIGTIIPDGRVSSLREETFKYVKPLRQGFMLKEGGAFKSWKKRWFILRHNILYYYKDPQDIKSQGVVPLQDTITEAVDADEKKKDYCFCIKNQTRRTYYMVCTSNEERDEWIKMIKEASVITGKLEMNMNAHQVPLCQSLVGSTKQGYLWKRGKKMWTKRWFLLHSNILYWFNDPTDSKPKGAVDLDGYAINRNDKITKQANSFEIYHAQRRSITVYGETENDTNEWILILEKSIKGNGVRRATTDLASLNRSTS